MEDTVKVTTRKAAFGGLALFGAAVLLAGCASAAEDSGASVGAAACVFLAFMVSDSGVFVDKSLIQLGFEGLRQAIISGELVVDSPSAP